MKRIGLLVALVCTVAGSMGGCFPAGSGGGLSADYEFTAARQEAVTFVVEHVVAAAGSFATLSALADPRVDLDGTGFTRFGTCPEVTFIAAGTSNAIVRFDFGDGCSAAATGTATISGAVEINASLSRGSARIQYSNLAVDGREVSGLIDALSVASAADGGALDGTCNIETEGVGRFQGDIFIGLLQSGQIIASADNVYVRGGTTAYYVELSTLTIDPLLYDNFVPESGRLTFTGPRFVEITVVFSRRSAEEGIVRVTVGNGSTLNFQAITTGG